MPKRKRKISEVEDELLEDPEDPEDNGRAPRNAANARERARMRVLSKAFCRLKTTLPWVPADTKLSKLDTLRLAATYIAHLRAVLSDDAQICGSELRPGSLSLTLSWPFTLQSPSNSGIGNGGNSTSSLQRVPTHPYESYYESTSRSAHLPYY